MTMFSRILCPVDFSRESAHALAYAIALGRWLKCSITGLHAYPVTVFSGVSGYPSFMPEPPDLDELRTSLRAFLSPAEDAGIVVDAIVEGGDPARTIIERARALPADLIVMGTHGMTGFERFALGSVAEKVLHKAARPVLTIPPVTPPPTDPPFTRIICAVDFSPSSLAGLELAGALAQDQRTRLTLVSVFEAQPDEQAAMAMAPTVNDYWQQREDAARRRLDVLVPAKVTVRAETQLRRGKPYEEVLAAVAEQHADLIVLGIHARHTFDLPVLGSTTSQIVRRASCPVLTVRPR
jgi:nucleotide-binding universal stress UspA family protein